MSTTVGRAIFNDHLPEEVPFVNGLLKKKGLQQVVNLCYVRSDLDTTVRMLDSLKDLGFLYSTKAGFTISISDLIIPSNKNQLVEDARNEVIEVEQQYLDGAITNGERYNKVVAIWSDVTESISDEMFSSMSGINQLTPTKSHKEIGNMLGNLIFERIDTIYSGWKNNFKVERILNNAHPYHKTLLDRVVIGQRLSDFLQSDKGSIIFSEMIRSLSYNCLNSEKEIINHYTKNEVFDKNRLILSNLRAAPIIGLAAKLSC